ncbi:hypothetical protein EB796_018401 [Bugula neritina]|uniref:Uncharacterized protein n=1 Tax=Bugula neritina TaxID=10212 RepID=A0A7J7JCB4_BUGNE|nr:hypothetical protein EB796_018401 [Bugula neritina]
MNIDLNKICGSVASTANHVGHQIGQYVDAHASGGLLSFFATGNVVCLVAKWTGKALQIVQSSQGYLVPDGLGIEGPQAFNTHWIVINEGNNIVRLHNNNNYLCINAAQIMVIPSPSGVPSGSETKLRVSQIGNAHVTLESVKEPGNFVAISQTGAPAPGTGDSVAKQFTPRLLHSPYGATHVRPHVYRI